MLLDDNVCYEMSCFPSESLDFDFDGLTLKCFHGKRKESGIFLGFHCLVLLISNLEGR